LRASAALAVELFSEYVRVNLFVLVLEVCSAQHGLHNLPESILAIDDGCAGVKNHDPARGQSGQPFDDDAHREIRAELAATVPIDPRVGVEQIRRIRDDEIDWLRDRAEQVSLPKAHLWDCSQRYIDARIP